MREPLTDNEWGALSESWSNGVLSDEDCEWACGVAYQRVTGWVLMESSICSFDVDTWGDTAALESSAAVVCTGIGTEYACGDQDDPSETSE